MSGKLAKSQIPFLPLYLKTAELMTALANLKQAVRSGTPLEHFNNDENQLPQNGDGYRYFEFQVGNAHANDPRPAGRKRLVIEAREIQELSPHRGIVGHMLEIYYTPAHYVKSSFYRLP